MSYLDELEQVTDPTPEELRRLLQRAAAELADWKRTAVLKLRELGERLDAVEQNVVALTVVTTVADLPASAPARQWFRVSTGTLAERASVYVGNGDGNPLTKIVPQSL